MTRISIVDDHPLVIDGVKAMLSNDANIVVIHSHTGLESLKLALAQELPDILLLDINLGEKNGMDACKELVQQYPILKIIALTNLEESIFVKNMIKHGAKGFLLKNVSNQELLEAIDKVLKGEIYIQLVLQKKMLEEQLGQKSAELSYIPKLTSREKQILTLIVEEYTSTEIADKLCISISTVESHRLNLFQKLGVKNVAGLVREAIQKGLI